MLTQLSAVRIATTIGLVVATLYAFPLASLRLPNGISRAEFAVLFIVPATLAAVSPLVAAFGRKEPVLRALTFAAAACEGIALTLGLQGFLVVYQWYVDPGSPHLEPLAVMLGLAAASAEACSWRIRALLKRLPKDPQSPDEGNVASDA